MPGVASDGRGAAVDGVDTEALPPGEGSQPLQTAEEEEEEDELRVDALLAAVPDLVYDSDFVSDAHGGAIVAPPAEAPVDASEFSDGDGGSAGAPMAALLGILSSGSDSEQSGVPPEASGSQAVSGSTVTVRPKPFRLFLDLYCFTSSGGILSRRMMRVTPISEYSSGYVLSKGLGG